MAVVTDVAGLDRCRADGTLAMVLHLEGAEAIDPGLSALDAWHAAGVRSIGLVWSRPSAFGHGVPFRFPASPDTGPGLTDAGRALVRRCAELGIVVDLSHLNAAGFADVVRARGGAASSSRTPPATRCAPRRATSPTTSCATSARSDGLVGIVFCPAFLRADGADDADTPLATLVAHVRHAAELAGIDHVGLGSDFDGAPMPAELSDVAALPRLLDALRDDGFSADEVERIAWGNWRRVLAAAWGAYARRSACGPTRAGRGRTPPSRSAGAASGRSRLPRRRRLRRRRRRRRARRARATRHARRLDAGDDEQRAGQVGAAGHDARRRRRSRRP